MVRLQRRHKSFDNDAAVEEEIIPITRQDDTPPLHRHLRCGYSQYCENNMDLDDELEILIQGLISHAIDYTQVYQSLEEER